MITKPCAGNSQESVAVAGDVVRQVNSAGETSDELSLNCTSLFIYDNVDRQRTSGVDSNYYNCLAVDSARPKELLYAPSQHSSQIHHVSQQQQQQQQQQCGGEGDEDAGVKLQLLAGCGSKTALEYPWMRDKKSTSDAMCLSTSMSDRRLKQCLTSDPLAQTPGM